MTSFKNYTELGKRWLTCGWRLFVRNPWVLAGMGLSCAVVITLFSLIPFLGSLLVGLFIPVFAASAYLVIHGISKQTLPLPKGLRITALKKSPLELLHVVRDEKHIMTAVVAGFYGLLVVLLTDMLVQFVAGAAWMGRWTSLDFLSYLRVLAALLLMLGIYVLLAASLAYALPLTFIQDEPLVPALWRSLQTSAKQVFPLLIILSLLLVPIVLAGLVSYFSIWFAYLVAFVTGTLVLPMVLTSLYCSYRTLFPTQAKGPVPVSR